MGTPREGHRGPPLPAAAMVPSVPAPPCSSAVALYWGVPTAANHHCPPAVGGLRASGCRGRLHGAETVWGFVGFSSQLGGARGGTPSGVRAPQGSAGEREVRGMKGSGGMGLGVYGVILGLMGSMGTVWELLGLMRSLGGHWGHLGGNRDIGGNGNLGGFGRCGEVMRILGTLVTIWG